jgi:hypothetical protein
VDKGGRSEGLANNATVSLDSNNVAERRIHSWRGEFARLAMSRRTPGVHRVLMAADTELPDDLLLAGNASNASRGLASVQGIEMAESPLTNYELLQRLLKNPGIDGHLSGRSAPKPSNLRESQL